MKRQAFTATIDNAGFQLGLAIENEPGYYPQPQFGRFDTYEQAMVKAEEYNTTLGMTPEDAYKIVCSSMFTGRRRKA